MVRILLVGFVCLNLLFSASWWGDFQWGSCGSNFSFLCHGRQTFSGVRVAQSLVFCVMVGRLLVGFVSLNLQFSGSRLVTFNGVRVAQSLLFCLMVGRLLVGSCGSIFSFLCHGRQTCSGVRVAQSLVLCHGRQTFGGVRVAQSLVFCVMVGGLLVGFVWLNLQFSVSWLVDFQWVSCGSIFSFLGHGWQIFRGVRVTQSLIFCVMVDILLVGFVWFNLQFSVSWQVNFQWDSCGSIFCFLCHGRQTFSAVRVAQSLVFCVMVGRLLVGFVWLNLQFSGSWKVDIQWGSCGSIFSFLRHGWQPCSGVLEAQSLVFCLNVGNFQWGSRGSIFIFVSHGWQTFSGVRVAQSLVFCVMVRILLVGFVWLNLQFYVSWLIDFQWGSCGSIFSFLFHDWQPFSVAQSLVFCVMVGRLLVGFVWLNLQFCVMIGRRLVRFVWLNLQFSVSWLVVFQWASCGSIFSLLCHGSQTFIGVRVAQSLVLCVMDGRLLVGFVWFNLQLSVSQLVDFQGGSCGSIFSFVCHGRQTFSGVRVAQSFVFCVMVGRLLVGFVWLNLQFSVSWLVDFQWDSCGSSFSFLCHGRQTFSGVRVAQSLVFCVMVGILLVGFVRLNLQFSVSRLATFSGFVWLNLQFSVSWVVDFQGGSCGSIFCFLRHGSHTFSEVRVSQSLVFCFMVGRLSVGFVWLNLQFSASWLVDFQWGS